MDKLKLKRASITDLFAVYPNYRHDFPKSERKPIFMILANVIKGKSDIFVLHDGSGRKAYSITLTDSADNAVLVDYLAVMSKYRSGGFGSAMLKKLGEYYCDKSGLIVEIENPETADTEEETLIRNRRRKFYEKNGFVMKPLKLNFFGVDMKMMYLKIKSEPSDFIKTAEDIYIRSLGEKCYRRFIRLIKINTQ